MGHDRVAVVDGANAAYAERCQDGRPKVSNLVALRKRLAADGYRCLIIVDASLRHEIDDPAQLEGLIEQQVVRQAPAGTDADYFVLATADQHDALVISNDRYQNYQDEYPWIDKRRIPFMIIDGEVQLYEPGEGPTR